MTPAEQATLTRIRAEMADILALVDRGASVPFNTEEHYCRLMWQAWHMDPTAPVQHIVSVWGSSLRRAETMAGWIGWDYAAAVEQTRWWKREHGWPVAGETQLRLELTG